MDGWFLAVGLGNPGADYARTRHNAGFMVLDTLAGRTSWSFEKKFNARVAKVEMGGRRVLLAQPQTYMNASGEPVQALAAFYRVEPAALLAVVDDADLP